MRAPPLLALTLLSLMRSPAARGSLSPDAGVLDEHFQKMDAKNGGGGGGGAGFGSGFSYVELYKWKANVPHAAIIEARRTMAELAATVPSLGPANLLSGEAASGSAGDLAVVAHFQTAGELEAYQQCAERRRALSSIRPLLAAEPIVASFSNDVPAVLAARDGVGVAELGPPSLGAAPGASASDYAAALEVLAGNDGKPAAAPVPPRAPPPPPSGPAPPATTADEAEAILEQHFKAISR